MQVLSRMEEYIKQEGVKPSDEAWLIVDRDQWDEKHLDLLHQWTLKCSNYKLALSNPKFEFWLLLHYEDAKNISTERECLTRLKHYLPNYNKKIEVRKITHTQIHNAVYRAEQRDKPPCPSWPRSFGSTTVYRLVRKILKN